MATKEKGRRDPYRIEMYQVGVLTVSDRGARGEREDKSGKIMIDLLKEAGFDIAVYTIVPDDEDLISKTLINWVGKGLDLILTTGGTGLSPRDLTPEATRRVIEREVPGIEEALRQDGLKKTPYAMLSRGIAGIRKQTLIINLPGGPKAVKEGLEVIIPALKHALEKIKGDESECG